MSNVLLAGGGSGHGFKHGPVLGEYLGRRALGQAVDATYSGMFDFTHTRTPL
jgi:glycine/D-amino acid oxidase-like deaminating enzyme